MKFVATHGMTPQTIEVDKVELHGKIDDWTITKITYRTIQGKDECVIEAEKWYWNGNNYVDDELLKTKFIAKVDSSLTTK